MKLSKSWRDYPMSEWRWPNFSPQEIASKGEGELLIDPGSMDKLQVLRTVLGKPMMITSAYRSAKHNKRVGGASRSQHRLGKAPRRHSKTLNNKIVEWHDTYFYWD